MRNYKYLFFLGLLILQACAGTESVPDNVISQDRMPAILADIHLVDGNMYNIPQQQDSMYKYGMGNYIAVLKKHHTDTAQFRRSFIWYTKNPDRLNDIYTEVTKTLQKKIDSIADIKPPKATIPGKTANPAIPANAVPAK
jgi:hypothetical protein